MIRSFHRKIGLGLSLILLVQVLSGLITIFRDDLWPAPDATFIPPWSLAEVMAAAKTTMQGKPYRIDLPQSEDAYYRLWYALPDEVPNMVLLAAKDLQPVKSGSLWSYPFEIAFRFHYTWLGGPPGEIWAGLIGLVTGCILLTGLALAWPRYGRWRRAFAIEWPASLRRIAIDTHRAIGLGFVVFSFYLAASGAYMLLAPRVEPARPLGAELAVLGDPLTADDSLALARALIPGAQVTSIRFTGGLHLVVLSSPQSLVYHRIWLDPAAHAPARIFGPETTPALVAANDILRRIHAGKIGGIAGKLALGLVGLSLLVQIISGLSQWLLRPRRPAK